MIYSTVLNLSLSKDSYLTYKYLYKSAETAWWLSELLASGRFKIVYGNNVVFRIRRFVQVFVSLDWNEPLNATLDYLNS